MQRERIPIVIELFREFTASAYSRSKLATTPVSDLGTADDLGNHLNTPYTGLKFAELFILPWYNSEIHDEFDEFTTVGTLMEGYPTNLGAFQTQTKDLYSWLVDCFRLIQQYDLSHLDGHSWTTQEKMNEPGFYGSAPRMSTPANDGLFRFRNLLVDAIATMELPTSYPDPLTKDVTVLTDIPRSTEQAAKILRTFRAMGQDFEQGLFRQLNRLAPTVEWERYTKSQAEWAVNHRSQGQDIMNDPTLDLAECARRYDLIKNNLPESIVIISHVSKGTWLDELQSYEAAVIRHENEVRRHEEQVAAYRNKLKEDFAFYQRENRAISEAQGAIYTRMISVFNQLAYRYHSMGEEERFTAMRLTNGPFALPYPSRIRIPPVVSGGPSAVAPTSGLGAPRGDPRGSGLSELVNPTASVVNTRPDSIRLAHNLKETQSKLNQERVEMELDLMKKKEMEVDAIMRELELRKTLFQVQVAESERLAGEKMSTPVWMWERDGMEKKLMEARQQVANTRKLMKHAINRAKLAVSGADLDYDSGEDDGDVFSLPELSTAIEMAQKLSAIHQSKFKQAMVEKEQAFDMQLKERQLAVREMEAIQDKKKILDKLRNEVDTFLITTFRKWDDDFQKLGPDAVSALSQSLAILFRTTMHKVATTYQRTSDNELTAAIRMFDGHVNILTTACNGFQKNYASWVNILHNAIRKIHDVNPNEFVNLQSGHASSLQSLQQSLEQCYRMYEDALSALGTIKKPVAQGYRDLTAFSIAMHQKTDVFADQLNVLARTTQQMQLFIKQTKLKIESTLFAIGDGTDPTQEVSIQQLNSMTSTMDSAFGGTADDYFKRLFEPIDRLNRVYEMLPAEKYRDISNPATLLDKFTVFYQRVRKLYTGEDDIPPREREDFVQLVFTNRKLYRAGEHASFDLTMETPEKAQLIQAVQEVFMDSIFQWWNTDVAATVNDYKNKEIIPVYNAKMDNLEALMRTSLKPFDSTQPRDGPLSMIQVNWITLTLILTVAAGVQPAIVELDRQMEKMTRTVDLIHSVIRSTEPTFNTALLLVDVFMSLCNLVTYLREVYLMVEYQFAFIQRFQVFHGSGVLRMPTTDTLLYDVIVVLEGYAQALSDLSADFARKVDFHSEYYKRLFEFILHAMNTFFIKEGVTAQLRNDCTELIATLRVMPPTAPSTTAADTQKRQRSEQTHLENDPSKVDATNVLETFVREHVQPKVLSMGVIQTDIRLWKTEEAAIRQQWTELFQLNKVTEVFSVTGLLTTKIPVSFYKPRVFVNWPAVPVVRTISSVPDVSKALDENLCFVDFAVGNNIAEENAVLRLWPLRELPNDVKISDTTPPGTEVITLSNTKEHVPYTMTVNNPLGEVDRLFSAVQDPNGVQWQAISLTDHVSRMFVYESKADSAVVVTIGSNFSLSLV